jgi:hypothetical protein
MKIFLGLPIHRSLISAICLLCPDKNGYASDDVIKRFQERELSIAYCLSFLHQELPPRDALHSILTYGLSFRTQNSKLMLSVDVAFGPQQAKCV